MRRFSLLIFILLPLLLFSEEQLLLRGYLSKEKLKEAQAQIDDFEEDELLIYVSSSGGDLDEALELAQAIYQLPDTKISVYIDQEAVGPAAIFPFLGDELTVSPLLAWGAIASDHETLSPAILRSKVRSFIPRERTDRRLWLLLADGMSDADIVVIEDNGEWSIITGDLPRDAQSVSRKGQRLVLDQNQLQEHKLATIGPPPKIEEAAAPKSEIEQQLKEAIPFDSQGENLIGQIEFDRGGITRATAIHVRSAITDFKEQGVRFVIIKLNTPGGEVVAAEEISKMLIDLDQNEKIPCVAFIDNWAVSAGALVAYSCRFIGTTKDGTMGAAEPILMGAQGGAPQEASEKVKSALRAEFANRAAYFDRNPYIAEAMVDKEIILVERGGEVIKLDSEEQIRPGDRVVSAKDKLLTLNAQQMMGYSVADFLVAPAPVTAVTAEQERAGEWPTNRSLLFTAPFFEEIPNGQIISPKRDWKARFFSILSNPIVSSLLFLGMMLGFYVEMNTPGFGFAGTLGLICLFFILLSSFAMEAVNWLEIIMLVTGLILIAVEIFLLPGFGIAGIIGIALTLVGLFAIMLPAVGDIDFTWDTGEMNASAELFFERLAWLSGALVVGVIAMWLLTRYILPRVSHLSRLVHKEEQDREKGYVAGLDVASLPGVGSKGIAKTPLRPAGKVEIDSKLFDAVTGGEFILAGRAIRVARYDGAHMVVEEIES